MKILLNLVLGAILFISLTACQTTKVIEYREVKIPIAVPCAVDMPAKPEFYFAKINENLDIFEKTKALLADRVLFQSYIDELIATLEICRR